MTSQEKLNINRLRSQGMGYKRIAKTLKLPENTVKSYFKRNSLVMPAMPESGDGGHFCLNCGVPVSQTPGRKEKKFCSDVCRNKWWNSHMDQVKRKSSRIFTCPVCGTEVATYGTAGKKYCSHACYIRGRFGGAECV